MAFPQPDVLVESPWVGSSDWNGGASPAGGSRTGSCRIVMVDGAVFLVASSIPEAQRKAGGIGTASTNPRWVAFDQVNAGVPIVLNAGNIARFLPPPIPIQQTCPLEPFSGLVPGMPLRPCGNGQPVLLEPGELLAPRADLLPSGG